LPAWFGFDPVGFSVLRDFLMGTSPHNPQDNVIERSVFRSGERDSDPNLPVRIGRLQACIVQRAYSLMAATRIAFGFVFS
jgi:hypothetical protein